jgi:hypothetical protein
MPQRKHGSTPRRPSSSENGNDKASELSSSKRQKKVDGVDRKADAKQEVPRLISKEAKAVVKIQSIWRLRLKYKLTRNYAKSYLSPGCGPTIDYVKSIRYDSTYETPRIFIGSSFMK